MHASVLVIVFGVNVFAVQNNEPCNSFSIGTGHGQRNWKPWNEQSTLVTAEGGRAVYRESLAIHRDI
uniref:Secreted protein n=1 Tax=Ixodes ricinus TaxID=34613 RepID=A0A6B0TSJ2_IXORI